MGESSDRRGGVPRWLQVVGAASAAGAAIVAIIAGLGALLHDSSDHGVHAYRQAVLAMCQRLQANENATDRGIVDMDDRDLPIYDKRRFIDGETTLQAQVSAEFASLARRSTPNSLRADANRLQRLAANVLLSDQDSLKKVSVLAGSRITTPQIEKALAGEVQQVARLGTDLNSALTDLAGAPCKATTS